MNHNAIDDLDCFSQEQALTRLLCCCRARGFPSGKSYNVGMAQSKWKIFACDAKTKVFSQFGIFNAGSRGIPRHR